MRIQIVFNKKKLNVKNSKLNASVITPVLINYIMG